MNFIFKYSMAALIGLLMVVAGAGWACWVVLLFLLAGVGFAVAWVIKTGRRLFSGAAQLCQ